MTPFEHCKFLGYVCEVTPQFVKIQFPSAKLLHNFYHEGNLYDGGNVGSYVVVEGTKYGFLVRVTELSLPSGEKMEITEKSINNSDTIFHPIGKAEILVIFDIYNPLKVEKTVSQYPHIGAKVYSCSDEQIGTYITKFGAKKDTKNDVFASLGKLTSNNAVCHLSLNSLFGRHCAVVGTTGGGKSWTVAKLIECITARTKNKLILIDATGEYDNVCKDVRSIDIGDGNYIFHYSQLTIDELYFLLKPSSKIQVPKLMDAIRSLKIVKLLKDGDNLGGLVEKGIIKKGGQAKEKFNAFYYRNIGKIESKYCDFDFINLAKQIGHECVWDTDKSDVNKWGGRNETDISNCVSLMSRVNNLLCTDEYNKIFGFNSKSLEEQEKEPEDIRKIIEKHINEGSGVLRLNFSSVSFDYQVREILVNSIGKCLLNLAREGKFSSSPLIVMMDEAHQFINKTIKDDYFETKPLDAFELISKEARKYGLFLCLATQMPRDIPIGTLSQMGTFIVHRLINEQDKKAIENAASAAGRSILSFLPILGEGEAVLVGVDFPMPLLIKIDAPLNRPNSHTPLLVSENLSN